MLVVLKEAIISQHGDMLDVLLHVHVALQTN